MAALIQQWRYKYQIIGTAHTGLGLRLRLAPSSVVLSQKNETTQSECTSM